MNNEILPAISCGIKTSYDMRKRERGIPPGIQDSIYPSANIINNRLSGYLSHCHSTGTYQFNGAFPP